MGNHSSSPQPVLLHNHTASLRVETDGGAITAFHFKKNQLNPLSFAFAKEDMPVNNRNGAPYRGHFACIGRWGPPSEGEIKQGVPDHGHFANMLWHVTENTDSSVQMEAASAIEGLTVRKKISIDHENAVFLTSETITNHQSLGRLCNIVQHPTLAQPFLSAETRVFCNAAKGFHYELYANPEEQSAVWPLATFPDNAVTNLSYCENGRTGVHSFVVNRFDEFGWVAAYCPEKRLLFGYLWNRKDYPWINHWNDYDGDKIRFRGLEFGTTGIHQPFPVMLQTGNIRVFNEPVFEYIDAGQSITKEFLCFLHHFEQPITGIQSIIPDKNCISVTAAGKAGSIQIPLFFNIRNTAFFPGGEDVKKMI